MRQITKPKLDPEGIAITFHKRHDDWVVHVVVHVDDCGCVPTPPRVVETWFELDNEYELDEMLEALAESSVLNFDPDFETDSDHDEAVDRMVAEFERGFDDGRSIARDLNL